MTPEEKTARAMEKFEAELTIVPAAAGWMVIEDDGADEDGCHFIDEIPIIAFAIHPRGTALPITERGRHDTYLALKYPDGRLGTLGDTFTTLSALIEADHPEWKHWKLSLGAGA